MTPLQHAERLRIHFGLTHLWVKNETVSLSGSFKDRGAVVAIREALSGGFRRVVTASSGNAGAAIAAHAARAGLGATVLVDPAAPPAKLRQIRAYGADIMVVDGLFNQPSDTFIEQISRIARDMDAYLAFFWEPVNQAIIQGFEVIAEEIVSQLGQAPDVVIIPTGGGDHLVAHARAYIRLWRRGVTAFVPQLVAVQPEGASPLVDAVRNDSPKVEYRPNPTTVASGLRVAFSGNHALQVLRDATGTRAKHLATTVSDADIQMAQTLLGTFEGLWMEPSGAAGVGALPSLVAGGEIATDATIVAVLTGAGWKD
ncbi:pyridoxal-phosphate dependent enzyme [Sulfobacillus harzensis]|uniref:Pyridoxal-phosphate dependent enzyme n=1 Tax=Sulfobacillus harzensis TaxID=2729629 RepID=A0A7Y0L880_9FIRM|nr:pyridoxal-phosphate dependent enzyme [Sulfobacillus harzensis]